MTQAAAQWATKPPWSLACSFQCALTTWPCPCPCSSCAHWRLPPRPRSAREPLPPRAASPWPHRRESSENRGANVGVRTLERGDGRGRCEGVPGQGGARLMDREVAGRAERRRQGGRRARGGWCAHGKGAKHLDVGGGLSVDSGRAGRRALRSSRDARPLVLLAQPVGRALPLWQPALGVGRREGARVLGVETLSSSERSGR